MKKFISVLLCFAIVITFLCAFDVDGPIDMDDEVNMGDVARGVRLLYEIPVGEGDGKCFINFGGIGGFVEGPEAIASSDDGRLYVLDSGQSQILEIEADGTVGTIHIPDADYPLDMAVYDDCFVILDSEPTILILDSYGELVGKMDLPDGMGSRQVMSLFARDDEIGFVTVENEEYVSITDVEFERLLSGAENEASVQCVADEAEKLDSRFLNEAVSFEQGIAGPNQMLIQLSNDNDITIETDYMIGVVQTFSDGADIYAVVEEVSLYTSVVLVESSIRKYDTSGRLLGMNRLPTDNNVLYPDNAVEVTRNGAILYMAPCEDAVRIYQITLGDSYDSQLDEMSEATLQSISTQISDDIGISELHSAGYGSPLSRSTVRTRAKAMANYSWTWNPVKYDHYIDGTDRNESVDPRPSHLSPTESHTVTGIPYMWGGWDSQYSSTDDAPWSTFAGALSYYTTYGPLVGDTGESNAALHDGLGAGIDCAGFVSAASGAYTSATNKPFPSTISGDTYARTPKIGAVGTQNWNKYSCLQPMDVFVMLNNETYGSHVMFFDVRCMNTGGVYTYESTRIKASWYDDEVQGAKRFWRSWSDLSLFTIRSFWQLTSGDDFNYPLTMPAKGSSSSGNCIYGESNFYKFTNTTGATITATITVTTSYGNPDLYIYNSSNYLRKSDNSGTSTETCTVTLGNEYSVWAQVYGAAQNGTGYTISIDY